MGKEKLWSSTESVIPVVLKYDINIENDYYFLYFEICLRNLMQLDNAM